MSAKKREIREAFESLVRHDSSYDPAVERAQTAMKHAEITLKKDYESAPYYVNQALEELNELWEHHATIAEITGRVYVEEPSYLDLVPDDWGNFKEDDRGMWFDVDRATLESCGIVVAFDDEDETDIKFGYAFTLPGMEDVEDEAPFVVFPDDVSANFLVPSSDAINIRLHEQYPALMKTIDTSVRPTASNATLQFRRLAEAIQTSDLSMLEDNQCEWLAQYLFERMNFDRQWQYIARIRGDVGIEEGGYAESVCFEEPYELTGFINGVTLARTDANSDVQLTVRLPASRDADDEARSYMVIPSASLESLRSTRPEHSVVEQIRAGRLEKLRAAVLTQVTLAPLEPELEVPEVAEASNKLPNRFEQLSTQQAVIAMIQEMAKEAGATPYDSWEEAAQRSKQLAEAIHQQLIEAELSGAHIQAKGGVSVLNLGMQPNAEDGTVTLGLHPAKSLIKVDPLFSVNGTIHRVCPAVESIQTDADETCYKVATQLLIDDPHQTQNTVASMADGYPLASLEVRRRSIVDIGEATEIMLCDYANTITRHERLAEFRRTHARHSVLKLISRLDQALNHADDSKYQALKRVEMVRQLAQALEVSLEPDELASAIEALFIDRPFIEVTGIAVTSHDSEEHDVRLRGRVVGVTTTQPNDDEMIACLVVQSPDDTLYYVDMTTIDQFSF